MLGVRFEVVKPRCKELRGGLPPAALVQANALKKALSVFPCEADVVVGADTTVVLDGKIYGKPESREDAVRILKKLSGNTHTVFTGVAVVDVRGRKGISGVSTAKVKIANLSEEEIRWYVETGEPMDKAGAYAVQGIGAVFIEEICGDYFAVVGLSLRLLVKLLAAFGFDIRREVEGCFS